MSASNSQSDRIREGNRDTVINESEIRKKGMDALVAALGRAEAKRFIDQVLLDSGDYTKWREYLFHGMTLEEISAEAQALWEKNHEKEVVS